MKVRLPIAMSLILSLLCSVASAQQLTPVNKTLADNAALIYWQAFSLMPEIGESEKKSLEDLLTGKQPAEQVAKTLRQANESMRLLHRATKISQCEWGLEYSRGAEMVLPHLSQARNLSRIACARAKIRFAEGKNQAAIDDILTTLIMARQMGEDPIVISLLVQYAIEKQARDVLLRHLPQLEKSELESLAAGIGGLPEGTTMADGWRMEKELVLEWFIQELRKPDNKDRILKMFGLEPHATALAKMSQKEILDGAIELRGVYDKIANVMASPPDQVDAFVKEKLAKMNSTGPAKHVGALIIPTVRKNRRAEVVHQVQSVMLAAAIAVTKDGQNALESDELRDPISKGPLQYKTVGGGFQLTSKLTGLDGKPVTLTVGGE